MQISEVSLALTWPTRLCLLRVLCMMPLLQAFPFPSTLGEVTLHLLSLACLFVYVGSGSSPLSCGVFLPPLLLQAFQLLIAGLVLLLLQAGVFVYSSHGRWVSPLSCGVFLPPPLSQAFLLLVAGRAPPLPPSPLWSGLACLFTVPGGIPLPALWHSVCPTLVATCLYCSYCLLLSFSFFPRWGSVCPGGYAVLAQGCLWKYCVPLCSPCRCLPKQSGHG
jgi:hypothetical protein